MSTDFADSCPRCGIAGCAGECALWERTPDDKKLGRSPEIHEPPHESPYVIDLSPYVIDLVTGKWSLRP